MGQAADRAYLLKQQYRDATNLHARIKLHTLFSTNPYDWFYWVFDHLDLPKNANILELGCGPGNLWSKNETRISPGWAVTLSDFSSGMITEAQNNLRHSNHRYHFETIDAQQIPKADGEFDAVIANHMLYHIPDRKKALAEVYRVLKPNGIFYCATNGERHLLELDAIYDYLQSELNQNLKRAFSARSFTLENGAEQLCPWFSTTVDCYEDSLHITEVEPLIAYMLSMAPWDNPQINQGQISGLRDYLETKIREGGSIYISKSQGIFVAKKVQ